MTIEQDRISGIRASRVGGAWLAAHPWIAIAFIAMTATTFALGSTVIRYAYNAGAGTLTIVMVRTTVATLGLGLVLLLLGVPLRLAPRERWASVLIGLFMAGYSGAFYMGMEYMPVGLTVVTFYTYPLVTGLFSWLTGRERFGVAGAIALPLAFFGLLLALDVSGGSFSLEGASWAMLGSIGFSCVLILSAWLLPNRGDSRPRTLVMLGTASVAAILASVLSGEIWFPTNAIGWAALLGSAVCYALGMTSILFAASVLGATRVAVVMNVEPIASLVLTFLILGERLGPLQMLGAGLVIAAIFLFRLQRSPAAGAAG